MKDIIRNNRKTAGLTQSQVADLIGIKLSTYQSYEEGRAKPKYDTLQKIADLFNCDSIDLVKESQGRPINPKDKLYERYRRLPRDKRKIIDFILNAK